MENNNKQMPEASSEKIPLKFVVEGKEYQTCNQYITGAELKQIAGIPLDTELFLSISKPYEDELIENEKTVNLARPETEYFFVKKKLHFTINGTLYTWYKQYIRGIQIRQLGNIPAEDEIYLAFNNYSNPINISAKIADARLWKTIPGTTTNNIQQIINYYEHRVSMLTEQINNL